MICFFSILVSLCLCVNRLLEKIVHHQTAGCPCCSYREQQHSVNSSNICLISVATAAARSVQTACCRSDETHLVTAYQNGHTNVKKCQSKLSGTVSGTYDLSDLGSCQFEDLLLLLTRSSRVLVSYKCLSSGNILTRAENGPDFTGPARHRLGLAWPVLKLSICIVDAVLLLFSLMVTEQNKNSNYM